MNVAILSSNSDKISNYYINQARIISNDLATRGFDLVFGGCSFSMMGACYKEFVQNNRKIYSYTTEKYKDDIINMPDAKHCVEKTTFDLKKALFRKADLIVALAGGIGTLSEVLSFLEENRSNDLNVPIIIYDTNNYYYHLIELLKTMTDNCFLNIDNIMKYIIIINNHQEWLEYIDNFKLKRGMIK